MKKIVLTLVALLSMTVVMAQNQGNERQAPVTMTHEQMTSHMATQLNLNADQRTRVAALNKEYQDMFQGAPTDGQQMKPEQQTKRQEYDKKLKKILTDDQFNNYEKKLKPACDQKENGQKKDKKKTTKKKTKKTSKKKKTSKQ